MNIGSVNYILFVVLIAGSTAGCGKRGDSKPETVNAVKDTTDAEEASEGGDEFCQEHRVPEKECGICHPELAETLQPGQGLKIRFPSETSAEKAGITATPARTAEAGAFVTAMGRLEFNQNRS